MKHIIIPRILFAAVLIFLLFRFSGAHEPLFGLGPHTIGKYAWAVESEFEKQGDELSNSIEILYGITPNVAITLATPYLFESGEREGGLGNITLRGKYRFIRLDSPGASTAFAFHGGVRIRRSPLVTGPAPNFFVGISFGHESRRHYAFADFRWIQRNSTDNIQPGGIANLEAAYGIRPWLLEYKQPDLVLLVEFLGEFIGKNQLNGNVIPGSGGQRFSVAPGFLFSIRNVMLKGGIKIPVQQSNALLDEDPTAVLGIEIHMPPFK